MRRVCRGREFVQRNFRVYGIGLKDSTPFVVQTIPEVTFNGQCLAEKISDSIENLI